MPKEKVRKEANLVLVDNCDYIVSNLNKLARLKFSGVRKSPVVALERLLRKQCPVSRPVSVRYRDLSKEDLCGRCLVFADKAGKLSRFEIEIDPKLPDLVVIDSFMHEWAHVMDYDRNGLSRKRHRQSWGVCYAQAWSSYADV
jgi:hypothetical protein